MNMQILMTMRAFTSCGLHVAKRDSTKQIDQRHVLLHWELMLQPDGMLRVWRLSGEELAAINIADIREVTDVKAILCRQHGCPPSMQKLLHNGSILEDSTKLETPIDLQLVLSYVTTDAKEQEAHRELVAACQNGYRKLAKVLLEAGVDKDKQNSLGYTSLMQAAKKGHVEIAQLLLEAGANIDIPCTSGCTALTRATENGHVEMVRLLLEAGADSDMQELFGATALMHAANRGSLELAQLLVEARANLNLQNSSGHSALMVAAETGQVDIARLPPDPVFENCAISVP